MTPAEEKAYDDGYQLGLVHGRRQAEGLVEKVEKVRKARRVGAQLRRTGDTMTPIDAIDHCLSTIDETDAPDLVAALRSAIELLPAEGAQGDRRRRPGPVAPSRRPRPAPSGVADAVAGVRRSGREAW